MTVWGIVVAAGEGTRLAAGTPKALAPLAGRPLLAWSLDAALAASPVEGVVVACGDGWLDDGERIAREIGAGRVVVCRGGATRHRSVMEALGRVPRGADRVVVHDAARPLARPQLFERAVEALSAAAGAVCAVPVADTLKRAEDGTVIETVDRRGLWRAQTPQAFRIPDLLEASALAGEGVTDEASALELAGRTVVLVPGDERNVKITTAGDLALAEAVVRGERA